MAEKIRGADSTVWDCRRIYTMDSGRRQVPVAGTVDGEQECAIVQLHSPIESLQILCTTVKEGEPPTIPDPRSFDGDPNIVFLSQSQTVVIPINLPSGTGHAWSVSVSYFYALRRPRALGAPIPTGKLPFDRTSTAAGNEIGSQYFDRNALGGDGGRRS